MLLRRLRNRLHGSRDEGAVLISVIGVSVIVMIVVALVAGSAITAATFTTTTRASLQSRAAADAGIDTVWAKMIAGSFNCSFDATLPSGLKYETDMVYYRADGTTIACTGTSTLADTPERVMVTSKGFADAKGVQDTGDTRTIIALFDIEINPGTVALDKAIFNDAGYSITNGVDIIDGTGTNSADVYSNGSVQCKTQNYIQGSMFIQGDLTVNNNCWVAGSVWVGGAVNASTQLLVNGDIMSAGGTGPTPTGVDLAQTWVGGTVVANGNITSSNTTHKAYCSVAGYQAKVCGSMVSIEGSVTLSNGSNVAGNIYAKKAVDLGSTNANLIVGGNVISNSQGLLASNANGSGLRVGGYVAVKGSSQVAKANIGNKIGSCATGTTGLVACVPASPVIPLTNLPTELNFPTNTRVVAPPRESLPRINSDAAAFAKWTGWTIEDVACNALDTRLGVPWTGKLLLNITGCTSPISWNNKTITLYGDLALFNDAGWNNSNTQEIKSNNSTKRTFMMIVPSDATLSNGTTPLVTWTQPLAPANTEYYKPVCASGSYGDLQANKMFFTNVEGFLYTPCDFNFANEMKTYTGQIYTGGTTILPNTATLTYKPINVPGAESATATTLPAVVITPTSRFDARS